MFKMKHITSYMFKWEFGKKVGNNSKYDLIILDQHGYHDDNFMGDELLTEEFLEVVKKYNDELTFYEYLKMKNDVGIQEVTDELVNILGDFEGKGALIRVQQHRGIIDCNRIKPSVGEGIASILNYSEEPIILSKLVGRHLELTNSVLQIPNMLKDNGVLFIPHSMHKGSPNKPKEDNPDRGVKDFENLQKYIDAQTNKSNNLRENILLGEMKDGTVLRSGFLEKRLRQSYLKFGIPLGLNRSYFVNYKHTATFLLSSVKKSIALEIRRDYLATDQKAASFNAADYYPLDEEKVKKYAQCYAEFILSSFKR